MEILIAILVLGSIIVVHELGHFLSAKMFKIPVKEFAIGMGPAIFSYEGEKTLYTLRSIPLGGFVNIEGMEVGSEVENGFNTKSALQRFIVLFAGVAMNFLMAFLIIYITLLMNGKAIVSEKPIVGAIISENEKKASILIPGDEIKKINGNVISNWNDIGKTLKKVPEKNKEKIANTQILRDGKIIDEKILLNYNERNQNYYLGITPEFKIEKYNIISGLKVSSKEFINISSQILDGFKMLVTGKVNKEEISGPLGIIKVVGEASRGGFKTILFLMILLSINVGIFNLLPFPALDGGRIIFVLLELVGIKVNKKLEERVHTAGMIILICLIIYVTSNDIFNLI